MSPAHEPQATSLLSRPSGSSPCQKIVASLALLAGALVLSPMTDLLAGTMTCLMVHSWEAEGVTYQGTCREIGSLPTQLAIVSIAPLAALFAWLIGPRTRRRTLFWVSWLLLTIWGIARSRVAEPLRNPEFIYAESGGSLSFYVGWPVPDSEVAGMRRSQRRRSIEDESRRLQASLWRTWADLESKAVMTINNAALVKEVADRIGREPVPDMVRRSAAPAERAQRILGEIRPLKERISNPPPVSDDPPEALRALTGRLELLRVEVEAAYEESGEVSRALGQIPAGPQ